MKDILFVCLGNVGRSQMAEAYYNNLTNSADSWSAGIQEDTPAKYGNPTKNIVDAMLELGIDVSRAIVKTVTQEMVDNSKKIYIMCKENQCPDFLLKSDKILFWKIEDPFEMSLNGTKQTRDLIVEKILLM